MSYTIYHHYKEKEERRLEIERKRWGGEKERREGRERQTDTDRQNRTPENTMPKIKIILQKFQVEFERCIEPSIKSCICTYMQANMILFLTSNQINNH